MCSDDDSTVPQETVPSMDVLHVSADNSTVQPPIVSTMNLLPPASIDNEDCSASQCSEDTVSELVVLEDYDVRGRMHALQQFMNEMHRLPAWNEQDIAAMQLEYDRLANSAELHRQQQLRERLELMKVMDDVLNLQVHHPALNEYLLQSYEALQAPPQ